MTYVVSSPLEALIRLIDFGYVSHPLDYGSDDDDLEYSHEKDLGYDYEESQERDYQEDWEGADDPGGSAIDWVAYSLECSQCDAVSWILDHISVPSWPLEDFEKSMPAFYLVIEELTSWIDDQIQLERLNSRRNGALSFRAISGN